MAVSTAALVSLTDTKTYLGIANTTSDARLELLIDSVSDRIERLCGRQFVARAYTTRVSGAGTDWLILPNRPVNSITSIAYVTGAGSDESTTLIESTDYRFEAETGIVSRCVGGILWDTSEDRGDDGRAFAEGFKNYEVVYSAGYASTSIPADLKLIALEMVASGYYTSGGVDPTKQSESLGDYSYTRADGSRAAEAGTAGDPIAGHILSRLARWSNPPIGGVF